MKTLFYAPKDPKELKKEREKARELKKSSWWKERLKNGVCYYCEQKFSPEELTMDHKVPLAKGGSSTKGNVVVACKSCNTGKKSLTSVEIALQNLEKTSAEGDE